MNSKHHHDLLLEAAIAIKRLVNQADPECPLCGGTTQIDGRGHDKECLIIRLLNATKRPG